MLYTAGRVLEEVLRASFDSWKSVSATRLLNGHSTFDAIEVVVEAVRKAENHNHCLRRVILLAQIRQMDRCVLGPFLLHTCISSTNEAVVLSYTIRSRASDGLLSRQKLILGPDFQNIVDIRIVGAINVKQARVHSSEEFTGR